MHPNRPARITAADVLRFPGRQHIVDGLWAREFGKEVEYQFRVIPEQLIYLTFKYGEVIPHQFFVESIQEVCAHMKSNPVTGLLESAKISAAKAGLLIDQAVTIGLITRKSPDPDRRFRLYHVSDDQLGKLYRIREAERQLFDLIEIQASEPDNFEAGKAEDNEDWYRHMIKDRVSRQDDVYRKDKAMLEKLRYLIAGLAAFGIGAGFLLMQVADALATISGGSK